MTSYKFQVGDKVLYANSSEYYVAKIKGTIIDINDNYLNSKYTISWDHGGTFYYSSTSFILFLNGIDKLEEIL